MQHKKVLQAAKPAIQYSQVHLSLHRPLIRVTPNLPQLYDLLYNITHTYSENLNAVPTVYS